MTTFYLFTQNPTSESGNVIKKKVCPETCFGDRGFLFHTCLVFYLCEDHYWHNTFPSPYSPTLNPVVTLSNSRLTDSGAPMIAHPSFNLIFCDRLDDVKFQPPPSVFPVNCKPSCFLL